MLSAARARRAYTACVVMALALTASTVGVRGQASPNYLPFDPVRIGLPALTESGRDYLIDQHRQLIEEARKNIQEIKQSDLDDAAERIARYNELIIEEFRQIARLAALRIQDATTIAAVGQVNDLPNLRGLLTTVLEASRFNALSGNEEEALKEYQGAVGALKSFSAKFTTACYSQSFDPRIALGLQRQNDMLGTGIDVTPCAYRRFTAEGKGADILWQFSHCGMGIGEWKIETSGPLQGKGTGTVEVDLSGTWFVDEATSERDVRVQYSGDMKFIPNADPQGQNASEPGRLSLYARRSTVTSDGVTVSSNLALSGLTFVAKKSDKPCRPDER
jgi:hypothetical protein